MTISKKFLILTILLLLLGFSSKGVARVSINIGVTPPPFVFSAPPPVVVVPGTYVYFTPDVDVDVFFYQGYWYRPYREYWYRSSSYNGPWAYLASPPTVLLNLPPDYRRVTIEHRRIPYGDLHRNWRSWERERYWERHGWGREERHDFDREHRERGHRERW
jgi:hypothetical protein